MTAVESRPGLTQHYADDALLAVGQFRAAWSWLAEAVHPAGSRGPHPTRHRPAVPAEDQPATTARYRYEHDAYLLAVRRGAKPSAPHGLPVNVRAVDSRPQVAATIAALAGRMWEWVHGLGLVLTITDRPTTTGCPWCHGHGYALKPDDWPTGWWWPDHPIVCSYCAGRTITGTGTTCPACQQTGGCRCDRHDIVVTLSLDTIADLIDHLGAEPLTQVAAVLGRARRQAEHAAGAGHDRRRLPGRPECPACGARELYAEVASPDPREWAICCGNPLCECDGMLCACGTGTAARTGRSHRWPSRIWDGPSGLADLLGVATPAARATFAEYLDGLYEQAFETHLAYLCRRGGYLHRALPIVKGQPLMPVRTRPDLTMIDCPTCGQPVEYALTYEARAIVPAVIAYRYLHQAPDPGDPDRKIMYVGRPLPDGYRDVGGAPDQDQVMTMPCTCVHIGARGHDYLNQVVLASNPDLRITMTMVIPGRLTGGPPSDLAVHTVIDPDDLLTGPESPRQFLARTLANMARGLLAGYPNTPPGFDNGGDLPPGPAAVTNTTGTAEEITAP